MRKNFLLVMASVIAIITGFIIWLVVSHAADSQVEDRETIEFIEEKYGMEAVIVSETEADFVEGHSYQMAFEQEKDVVFTVTVDVENYATIYRDEYEAVRTLHETRQQVEELVPDIEALGFTVPSDSEELVDHVVKNMKTGETVRWLNLETADSYETIERPEVEKMKNLLDLQRQSGFDVQKINIRNKGSENIVILDLRTMGEVHSVEEVEAHVVGTDLRLAGNRMQTKWQDAATQAETERFRFHNEGGESWISCQGVNGEGDCINLIARVDFAPGELSQQNPHLEEDLNAIFDFFDNIQPKPVTVDLMMTDPEREGNPVRFHLQDRKNYASTEQLIQALVKE